MTGATRPLRASTTVDLPADPRSPALARRHLTAALRGGPHESLLDDALLLVTELVTNAVVHAGTAASLSIDTTDPGSLRLEVVDRSPATVPAVRAGSPTSSGGRGLQLLHALSTSWGTVHSASEKSVWFILGDGRRRPETDEPAPVVDAATVWPPLRTVAPEMGLLRWLLMLDVGSKAEVVPNVLLAESVNRLCDALGIESAVLVERRPDRPGDGRILAERGAGIAEDVRAVAVARAEGDQPPSSPQTDNVQSFRVASSGHTLAVLVIERDGAPSDVDALAVQLTCWRLATILSEQRLRAGADRARGDAALLAEASELFAGTLDADLALNLVSQLVVPRFGTWAAVWAFADQEPALSAVTHQVESGVEPLRRVLGGVEGGAFVRRVSGLLHGTRSALIAAADLPAGLRAIGTGEVLAVSLVARRRLLAVMVVASSGVDERMPDASAGASFDADSVAMLVDVATRAAVGVDVALLFEEQQGVAQALQTNLLPPDLPFNPDLEFGARYVAAGEMNTVGGDFYDVFALDNGDWVMLVGDVCGRGPEAAAITGLARSVLRVCLRDGLSGAEAYARLNREILELGPRGRFCTSALAILRPGLDHTTTVSVTVAGHPLPVLAKADGQVETIGIPGTLVGVEPQLSLHQVELSLSPGDAMILYTDGVTERRRGTAMFDEDGLFATVKDAVGKNADGVAATVEQTVRDFSPEPSRDDLAVVVVRQPALALKPIRRGALAAAVVT